MPHFLDHSSVNRHLFPYLVSVDNAAVNTGMQNLFKIVISFPLAIYPTIQLLLIYGQSGFIHTPHSLFPNFLDYFEATHASCKRHASINIPVCISKSKVLSFKPH